MPTQTLDNANYVTATPALKGEAYAILRESGLSQSNIAKLLGYSQNTIPHMSRTLEKKRKELFSGRDAKIAKKTTMAVMQDPESKGSDRLKAVEIVLDRTHPAVQKIESTNLNVTLSPDIQSAYLADLVTAIQSSGTTQPPPIDVTPEPDPNI